ncbi:MAG: elongation factor P maturation arginine rhamnosyltransferase EarP [Rhodocyclales bacterium]|nr:elongation factor P maturation arginine rhamnosyltransferase EarP [Rhodocyclales bacterium]
MTNKPTRCDIFCAVVDNYGDAGVCWRLARQLASEHGWQVRLWIDDAAPLLQLAPDYAASPVDVRVWLTPWPVPWLATECADVVIEAFACALPQAYVEAMATRSQPPVWLNLEYLSAESWVTGCHAMSSPHPRLPLVKYFFFPGFDEATGGLLRERDYDARRKDFDESAFRAELGLPPRAQDELTISLFSYPNPALPDLVTAWTNSDRPIRVLRPGSSEVAQAIGSLSLHSLPFLPQARYDDLLWACDLNFVRGEDSFVRAQWAGKPFVWQIYPQTDAAHLKKLDAFLAIHPAGTALGAFWQAWNGAGTLDWPDFAASLPALGAPMLQWARTLAARRDLASRLVQFCLERLK